MKNNDKAIGTYLNDLRELREHITELEVSGNKGKRIKDALLEIEEFIRSIYDGVQESIWFVDVMENRDFRYVGKNRCGETQSGIPSELFHGKSPEEVYPPLEARRVRENYKKVLRSGKKLTYEECLPFRGKGKKKVWWITTLTPLRDRHSRICRLLGASIDITELKQVEEALRVSERNYSTLVENSLTGIYVERDGKITFANSRFAEILGYTKEELVGMETSKLLSAETRDLADQTRTKSLPGEETPSMYEARGLTKDGDARWVVWRQEPIEYKRKSVLLGNIVDITDRKKMENALRNSEKQLRLLTSQLLFAQEEERRRISRELHDELGQSLTYLKYQLRSIQKMLFPEQMEPREECRQAISYVDKVIENVQRLSRDLSPSILEDLGLSAALRWLTDHFAKHYDIDISLDNEITDHLLPQEAQIIIYRIFQESFTNIVKHAQASRVVVKIARKNDGIFFVVKDDGKGFNVKNMRAKRISENNLGLTTMAERVKILGGCFDIWSRKNQGTRITFTIPIKKEAIVNESFPSGDS